MVSLEVITIVSGIIAYWVIGIVVTALMARYQDMKVDNPGNLLLAVACWPLLAVFVVPLGLWYATCHAYERLSGDKVLR